MRNSVPDWVMLTEDEEIHWFGGPSVARLARQLAGATVLIVVGMALVLAAPSNVFGRSLDAVPALPRAITVVGLVVLGIGIALGMVIYLRHSAIGYVVTTEELYVKRGLISRDVTNVRLERVQDTGFTQSGLQRVLGYGDVTVSTAGSGGIELRFEDVDDPAEVNNLISRRVDEAREGHDRRDDRDRDRDRRDSREGRDRRDDQYGQAGGGAGAPPDSRPVPDDRADRDDRPRRDDRDAGEY